MAGEFCRSDARCKAVVLLDAGPTPGLSANLTQLGLQKPFLSMNSAISVGPVPPAILCLPQRIPGSPEWLAATLALFTNAMDNAFWFQIQDSGHQSFQDRGTLISDPSLMGNPTPTSRGQNLTIKACMLSFFNKYLKGEDDHLLDNPALVYTNIINFRSK
jgi:pimeloyl-ACP methyl ester carboxylesterase